MERYVPLPPLPGRIGRLNELAYDLWWSWNPAAREVFRGLDYPLWRFTDHNPVLLLHLVEPDRLEHAASDPEFLAAYDAAIEAFDRVRSGAGTWWDQQRREGPIVWITRQFALHQSLPVHATPAGVLSGDLVKQASDLGIPFVGVGLMYARAYPHQRLTPEGWQQEALEYLDWSDAPITPALCPDGSPCEFSVPIAGTEIQVAVWQVCAGRSRVFLLDTDVAGNAAWDRDLSSRTTSHDAEARLRQCVLLGSGAVVALDKLGIEPAAWHLAGAEPSTVIIERLARAVAAGVPFADASTRVRATTFFSNRVDAPSAADACRFAAFDRHLAGTWPALIPHRPALLALGRFHTDRDETFNPAVLAARQSAAVVIAGEGVHLESWVSAELGPLLAPHRADEGADASSASGDTPQMSDEELWAARQRLRGYLVDFMRERARRRWAREQASGSRLVALGTLLDSTALTIGCAPRFGGGGHAERLFDDADRLARIVTAARRPVQFVFAGRVDANDESGKHRLQRMLQQTMDPAFGGRLAFLEDHDLHVARLMIQGCDLWLTLPPHADGPSLSAIKAAVNGVPHLGPADAWYPGAPPDGTGWIADDARTVYTTLEEEIVPAFYDRDRRNVPERWVACVRRTVELALPRFSARRALIALMGESQLSA